MTWRFHAESLIRFGSFGYRLYVMQENRDGSGAAMLAPTLKRLEQHQILLESDCFLDDGVMPDSNVQAFLQAASDAAWKIGIKPKQLDNNNNNELSAVRYHLEDMRQLAGVKK